MKRIGLEHVRLIETAHGGGQGIRWSTASGWAPRAMGCTRRESRLCCAMGTTMCSARSAGEWLTPPLSRGNGDGNLYARGAVDDKGQMYMHLKALESLFQTGKGKLPVNVRVILEVKRKLAVRGLPTSCASIRRS